MISVDPKSATTRELHNYILGAVGPRPIAFASTVDEAGNPNLSPFSFFNAYSSNPPILIFSANRRVRNNTTKDTYSNIKATKEVVINVVRYEYVRKMGLTSIEFPANVNEFKKAGFTAIKSEKVRPLRVGESPVQFECKVNEVIELGQEGGAGNLFICEVVLIHVDENILDDDGKIDPQKIDLVGRLGGANYVRVQGDAIFQLVQPVDKIAIGFDQLPDSVKFSKVLTGNELAQLAGVVQLPSASEIALFGESDMFLEMRKRFQNDNESLDWHIHEYASQCLSQGDATTAWKALLQQWWK